MQVDAVAAANGAPFHGGMHLQPIEQPNSQTVLARFVLIFYLCCKFYTCPITIRTKNDLGIYAIRLMNWTP